MKIPKRWFLLIGMALLWLGFASPALAVPQPAVTLNIPERPMVGEDFTFTVAFANVGADIGYGPFIDVVFPRSAGIRFVDARYLGTPLPALIDIFPPGGCLLHPFLRDTGNNPVQVCGTPGDELAVIQLPFGSFTPAQPQIPVTITANLSASANPTITNRIYARGGFRFGADPLNNPCCDPPLISTSPPNSALWPSIPVTPLVVQPGKAYLGPSDESDPAFLTPIEPDETVAGVNAVAYPVQYAITVDIAAGQTVDNLQVTEYLPPNMALNRIVPGPTTPGFALVSGAADIPGDTLVIQWPAVSGTASVCDVTNLATCDVVLVIEVYIPYLQADGVTPSINPATGAFAYAQNTYEVDGDWTSPGPGNATFAVGTAGARTAPLLVARSLAVQKSVQPVGPAAVPGEGLNYTLEFQVSDFFAFDQVIINDTLYDGQSFDPTFQPVLTLIRTLNGVQTFLLNAAPIAPGNFTVGARSPADGSTPITFDLSGEIIARGLDATGRFVGGCIDPINGTANPDCTGFNDGLLSGFVIFRTVIDDEFLIAHTLPGASGDASVDQGDRLRNEATLSGRLLDTLTFAPPGAFVTDNSLRTLTIDRAIPQKLIYAINGVVCAPQPCATVEAETGDSLTYRIRYDLATSDFEDLVFTDFLPLPTFRVSDPDGDGIPGPAWAFVPVVSAAAPLPGIAQFGPADTFNTAAPGLPILTTDAVNNALIFTYGTFDDPANQPRAIDLLFTVTVTGDPFADGLTLSNQVSQGEGSTNAGGAQQVVIASFGVFEPLLAIRKGVIATTNTGAVFSQPTGPVPFSAPGSTGPRWNGVINSTGLAAADINSDVSGLDPGDIVTFALVIENTGSSARGAFDVRIRDVIPAGYSIPANGLNLTVTRGDGSLASFIEIGGGLFDTSGGIELIDPSAAEGVCQTFHPTNGLNIVVITYDLAINPDAVIPSSLRNIASILQYANADGLGLTANHVDSREQAAFSDTADTVVGFLNAAANVDFLSQVTQLPSTGLSPWRIRRDPLLNILALYGLVLMVHLGRHLAFLTQRPPNAEDNDPS